MRQWFAWAPLGALLVWCASAQAQDGEAERREAEMFGGGEEEPEAPVDPAESVVEEPAAPGEAAPLGGEGREEALFGGGAREGFELQELEDPLAVGGRLFLQLAYFNREGEAPQESGWSSPNLLDVYLDARPDDRLRGYVRARLTYNPTVGGQGGAFPGAGAAQDEAVVRLDQLFVKTDVGRALFVTVGKQRVRWGSGRFWNPTDFLNQQRLDPLGATVLDVRLGVNLVKLHVPLEELGWNLYALADLEQAGSPQEAGGALRLEAVFGQAELALSGAARKGSPWRLGVDLSAGVWALDVHVEAALTRGLRQDFYRGTLDLETLTVPEAYSREDEWIAQVVAGGDVEIAYGDQDSVLLGAEYFYNQAGYEDASLYPWLVFQGAFTPFYLGRHYGSLFAALIGPGDWNDSSVVVSALGNLSDQSYVGRLDYRVTVREHLQLNAYGAWHAGREGELRFGLRLPATPLVPGLEEGFVLGASRLDLGLGLSMDL